MNIATNRYEIASLPPGPEALRLIQETEAKLAALTGEAITLIAYAAADASDPPGDERI
ncbi:hypothetical protein [Paenibacillus puerhi]|uniref:hypothetical protein n=1 Tax=Paenibacillus puerhi TaxID=2692622 RepID=UPI0019158FF0|nr:hypothetical protein [Paenibacillus puerhi]